MFGAFWKVVAFSAWLLLLPSGFADETPVTSGKIPLAAVPAAVAFSPDGETLGYFSRLGVLYVIDTRTGMERFPPKFIDQPSLSVLGSRELPSLRGFRIANDGTISSWIDPGSNLPFISEPSQSTAVSLESEPLLTLDLSPAGEFMVGREFSGGLTLWDLALRARYPQAGRPLLGPSTVADYGAVAFYGSQKWVVVGPEDQGLLRYLQFTWAQTSEAIAAGKAHELRFVRVREVARTEARYKSFELSGSGNHLAAVAHNFLDLIGNPGDKSLGRYGIGIAGEPEPLEAVALSQDGDRVAMITPRLSVVMDRSDSNTDPEDVRYLRLESANALSPRIGEGLAAARFHGEELVVARARQGFIERFVLPPCAFAIASH